MKYPQVSEKDNPMLLPITDLLYKVPKCRVGKCHGCDGYIRVKILAGCGKSLGKHTILQNQALFRDAYAHQNGRIFGKLPGGVISDPKNFVADF